MQSLIADLMARLSDRVRNSVLGSPAHPTRLAHAVHIVLNHLSMERYPLLRCHGVVDGYRMRVEWSRDRSFLYGMYEREVVDTPMRVVGTGQVVMDLGSNHGFYALLLSRLAGLSGLVITFEPLPASLKLLRENVELNGCENVRVVGQAVMDRHGEFELCVAGSRSTLVALQPSPKMQGPNMRVSALPLDEARKRPYCAAHQELLTSHILAASDQRARRHCEATFASHDKVERFRDGRSTS